jgi:hypothetical protein
MAKNALVTFLGFVLLHGTASFVPNGVSIHSGIRLRGSAAGGIGTFSHLQAKLVQIETLKSQFKIYHKNLM